MNSAAARLEQDIRTVQSGKPLPPLDSTANPIQEALDNYVQMEQSLVAAQDELKLLKDQAVAMAVENEQLRAALHEQKQFYQAEVLTVRGERDLYQNYAVELRSRFSAIKEALTAAENEAMKWAVQKIKTETSSELTGMKPVISVATKNDQDPLDPLDVLGDIPDRTLEQQLDNAVVK